jgi:hypothetical protein
VTSFLDDLFNSIPDEEMSGFSKVAGASVEALLNDLLEEQEKLAQLPPELLEGSPEEGEIPPEEEEAALAAAAAAAAEEGEEKRKSFLDRGPAEGSEGDEGEVGEEGEVFKGAEEAALQDALTIYFGSPKLAEDQVLEAAAFLVKEAEAREAEITFGGEVWAHAFANEITKLAYFHRQGVLDQYLEEFEKMALRIPGLSRLTGGARQVGQATTQKSQDLMQSLKGLSKTERRALFASLGISGAAGLGVGAAVG